MSDLDAHIVAALRRVYDPCSVAQQRPISIYDLGLVGSWRVDERGHATVRMRVTSPSCQMAAHFLAAAQAELVKVPGVRTASCEVDATELWTPSQITAEGKASLESQRAWSRARRPPRPVGGQPRNPSALLAFTGPGQ